MNKSVYHLNLTKDSKVYHCFSYPDGSMQVRINEEQIQFLKLASEIRITARINHPEDIIHLSLLRDTLTYIGGGPVNVILPYLPYSRADRRFTPGDCHGLKTFAQILNYAGYGKIITLDTHNKEISNDLIYGFRNVDPKPLIQQAIVDFARKYNSSEITILFPDEGAKSRYDCGDVVSGHNEEIKLHIKYCSKNRNSVTGVLEGFEVPTLNSMLPILIVDDICDGGGTFIGIGKEIKKQFEGIETWALGLYVTHGIFSKGMYCFNDYFNAIYTTNTWTDAPCKTTEHNGMGLRWFVRYDATQLLNQGLDK